MRMSKTIYLDSDFKCHVKDIGSQICVETDYFDGKCDTYIEGYRYVPAGATWTRPDGVVFEGEMISPCKDYAELEAAQRAYEQQEVADMRAALALLGVNVNEQMA